MRIVIDLQGAQTESRFRGIGRYSIAIARGIIRNNSRHEIFIALSAMLDESSCAVISRTSSAESLILLSWAFSSAKADMPEEKMTAAARISITI